MQLVRVSICFAFHIRGFATAMILGWQRRGRGGAQTTTAAPLEFPSRRCSTTLCCRAIVVLSSFCRLWRDCPQPRPESAMKRLPAASTAIPVMFIAEVYGRAAIAGVPYRSVPRHHRQYFFGVDFEHEIIICVSDVNIAAGIYGHSGNDSGRRMCRGYWSGWNSKSPLQRTS